MAERLEGEVNRQRHPLIVERNVSIRLLGSDEKELKQL
jgi:hypothetical protein